MFDLILLLRVNRILLGYLYYYIAQNNKIAMPHWALQSETPSVLRPLMQVRSNPWTTKDSNSENNWMKLRKSRRRGMNRPAVDVTETIHNNIIYVLNPPPSLLTQDTSEYTWCVTACSYGTYHSLHSIVWLERSFGGLRLSGPEIHRSSVTSISHEGLSEWTNVSGRQPQEHLFSFRWSLLSHTTHSCSFSHLLLRLFEFHVSLSL